MLLNTYGHGDGEVDVRRLLIDAGTSFNHSMNFITSYLFYFLSFQSQECGMTDRPAVTLSLRTGAVKPKRTSWAPEISVIRTLRIVRPIELSVTTALAQDFLVVRV